MRDKLSIANQPFIDTRHVRYLICAAGEYVVNGTVQTKLFRFSLIGRSSLAGSVSYSSSKTSSRLIANDHHVPPGIWTWLMTLMPPNVTLPFVVEVHPLSGQKLAANIAKSGSNVISSSSSSSSSSPLSSSSSLPLKSKGSINIPMEAK
jgi:hypothetical protein